MVVCSSRKSAGLSRGVALNRTHVQLLAALVGATLLLSACLSGEVDVRVDPDGSSVVVVELLAEAWQGGAVADADLDALLDAGVAGSDEVDLQKVDGGVRATISFDDYRDMVAAMQGGVVIAGQRVQLFDSVSLIELPGGEGWDFNATVLPLQQVVDASVGALRSQELLEVDSTDAVSDVDIRFSISLPGEVVSSDATRVDRGTATWDLDDLDAAQSLRVRTEPAQANRLMFPIVAAVVLALLAGVAVVVIRARRRRHGTEAGQGVDPDRSDKPIQTADERPDDDTDVVVSDGGNPGGGSPGTPVPGWYVDPADATGRRWWDGERWTDRTG
jgi:hypothetical protein